MVHGEASLLVAVVMSHFLKCPQIVSQGIFIAKGDLVENYCQPTGLLVQPGLLSGGHHCHCEVICHHMAKGSALTVPSVDCRQRMPDAQPHCLLGL